MLVTQTDRQTDSTDNAIIAFPVDYVRHERKLERERVCLKGTNEADVLLLSCFSKQKLNARHSNAIADTREERLEHMVMREERVPCLYAAKYDSEKNDVTRL